MSSLQLVKQIGATEQGNIYSHSNTCRKRIVEQKQDDPEYRWLMKTHDLHQEFGDVEMLTKEQLNEKRHNVNRVINVIKQDLRRKGLGNCERLIQTMFKIVIVKIEVAEVYNPPRVIAMAKRIGMKASWGSFPFSFCETCQVLIFRLHPFLHLIMLPMCVPCVIEYVSLILFHYHTVLLRADLLQHLHQFL